MDDTVSEMALEEQILDVENIEDTSEVKEGSVVEGSDQTTPMTVAQVIGNDKILVYDTKTGEPSVALRYLLPRLLEDKNKDGTRRWTTKRPQGIIRKAGKIKCLLHPDNANRKEYDDMGFSTCYKHNLPSEHALRMHMMHRHKVEWEAIEMFRKEAERKEERDFQRGIIKRATGRTKTKGK